MGGGSLGTRLCGVCEVRVPRSRFPGNLAVVSETVGVSSHRELPNQTFIRATPTLSVNTCIAFNRESRAQERFWRGLVASVC